MTAFSTPAQRHPFEEVDVLGYAVARCTLLEAAAWCLEAARRPGPKLLVTLNPEIIVQAREQEPLRRALQHAHLTVADGVGILWAARHIGHRLPERVPGVDLMTKVLEEGGSGLRVFFLGAKPGVAQRAAKAAQERYGTVIAGVQHGYFERPNEVPEVVEHISKSRAQLLLAGLGEGQELFLHEHRDTLGVPLMIGVGGALDVLSGKVQRTPQWTRRWGVEWAYRVGLDRKRWHRFPRLIQFMRLVERERMR